MDEDLRALLNSTGLWFLIITAALFFFLAFGARPVLRILGTLLGLMGGGGLEGTDL